MRFLLLLASLVAACHAHGAEHTAPRRSLTFDLFPTGPRSDSDKDKCWESLLTLGLCKHDLLASFSTGRPLPPACCRAADEVDDHCGPLTRAFLGSLLPHGLLQWCASPVITGAPTIRPIARRAPPRAPYLATGPRVSGGARSPPGPEAYTSVRFPPPRAPKASSGTHIPTPPNSYTSVYLPPPYPPTVSRGKYTPPPKVTSGTHAPVVSGSPREAEVRGAPAVPVYENTPEPKVIAGGGAGGRTRRAPEVYGPATGALLTAASVPQKGVRTASPSPSPSLSPKSLPYGTPV